MHFATDKQTLEDLHIFGKYGSDAVFQLFNRTLTRGGAAVLENMFRHPLASREAIGSRSEMIRGLQQAAVSFPFQAGLFDVVEQYLENTDERSKVSPEKHSAGQKLSNLIGGDAAYKSIYKGVTGLIQLLQECRHFITGLPPGILTGSGHQLDVLLEDADLRPFQAVPAAEKLPVEKIAAYDRQLRFQQRARIRQLLDHIYHLDAYIAVAKVAAERKFVFPVVLPAEQQVVRLEGVYHPQVKNAVGNNLLITPESNVVFLTGANMAGKSTFMKTLGIALYLAHMGFPVPAAHMEFSVRDGLFTTINLADNLNAGVSHFYAEVLRIKMIAGAMKRMPNLFVIVDELFRGTNVKDACEATIAITGAFARQRSSMFVVSTHIIEAGEVLEKACSNINFVYLPTRMEGQVPVYTYVLKKGITADRHGMIIIQHEGIIDMIRSRQKKAIAP